MAELPNWKIKRKTRTPAELRNVMSRDASVYLCSCLNSVKSGVQYKAQTEKRSQSAAGTFSFKKKRIRKKEKQDKPGEGESIELIAMRQFRKGLMMEIGKQGELNAERLEAIRTKSVQKDFLDADNYRKKQQQMKMKKELLSRSPLDNAIYMLRAMPRRGRKLVVTELKRTIPQGIRFLRSKPCSSA